jgi:DNA topoisomerase-1
MSKLVIVESAGKISKISQILGKDYIVKASMGHIRDLDPKKMSINFENHFEPIYVTTKPDVVKKLKEAIKKVDMVYLASDPDREGSAIAKSLYEILKPKNYRRIRFNAITHDAIMDAIKNAGEIEEELVNAQKARRVLDRLYGYLISPILQKQIGGVLSAGRVQSVTTKLIVDKEREIQQFLKKNSESSYFKVKGLFSNLNAVLYEASNEQSCTSNTPYTGDKAKIPIVEDPIPNIKVIVFLKRCLKSNFRIRSITSKVVTRSPSAPFETSTLQQEASRKFGMSVDLTMKIAQKLYEGGYITYMRTDSVEISQEGHREIKKIIEKKYGSEYYQKNIYKSKVANAQEAHEAIRPTHPDLISLEGEVDDYNQIKLYRLIWQRTIASQMKPAKIKVITIQISISKFLDEKIHPLYYFQSNIESIIFPGFMKVYVESQDEQEDENGKNKDFIGKVPSINDEVVMEEIEARQEYLKPPPRYSEASLVKKLKELGIGRPSTYVSTIKTILQRDYVKIGDIPGINKEITIYTIKSKNQKHIMTIFEENTTTLIGKDTKKIIPTSLGITVNDFLVTNFPEMMDYHFTAKMEEELDAISRGEKIWYHVVKHFYNKLKPIVDKLSKMKNISKTSERLLGKDNDDNEIYASITKYGPVVKKKINSKYVYAKIKDPHTLETISLEDAKRLLEYPKLLGKYNKKDIFLKRGDYGFYLTYNSDNYSLPEGIGQNIKLEDAIDIIKKKRSNQLAEFVIKDKTGGTFRATVVIGQYGPYVQIKRKHKKTNYPIPKDIDPNKITEEKILEIIYKPKKQKHFSSKKNGNRVGGYRKKYKSNSNYIRK